MNQTLSLRSVGLATSAFIAISFVLCVAGDLVMPAHEMHSGWQRLLPGFEWISWGSFFLGLVESYAYGWYIALIWVPLYNVSVGRQARRGEIKMIRNANRSGLARARLCFCL